MSEIKRPKRRIKVPKRSERQIEIVPAATPNTEMLLHDAKTIIQSELARYLDMVKRNVTLDPKQARIVQGYLKELNTIAREEREAAKHEDLSSIPTEELAQMLMTTLGVSDPKKLVKLLENKNDETE